MINEAITREYLAILKEEIVPALGCTEPIAIAYAAATARDTLGNIPTHITVHCSGNIIKNVKSVVVPTTGDLRGIETSAVLGAVGGDASLKLQVLSAVTPEQLAQTKQLLKEKICNVELLEGVPNLSVIVEMQDAENTALVEVAHAHTNIVRIEKNSTILFAKDSSPAAASDTDRTLLNLADIYEFACTTDLTPLKSLLDQQVYYNMEIAEQGLCSNYGANVGSTIIRHHGNSVYTRAKAYPAAGSDARMNGCVLPVVINCGSGNQGLTASLPVEIFAQEIGASAETRYRALVLSNLVAIYQKNVLGKLSAYCGVVSAAVGAGVGIGYLHGCDFDTLCAIITNTLASVSGIVCDGAKSSCAAKIASAVDACMLAFDMARDGQTYQNGEGLVKGNAEKTIQSYGQMGREGMRSTDLEILKLMMQEDF